ncbi:MAG: hypothetical protein A2151_00215 [Candidatus Muproteobacteria bacterium RBG_16_65_34]|uniref:Uncharacterized protein n=1 Tax=Candidatus Muproteobacteria bacterium RBG_16_65_34 TaxID=1817760 RepID=A0A1F6TPL7_9PROT|nr:MAG: hypothetical protein A2151_00215 [Candidatus Muproteobacteria bacterium RBG_16_65_34]
MNTAPEREEQLVLELLDAVGKRSDLSQRHLAHHMGVALGLANSYLKRCVRKGLIKITEVPANRYLYYLTPKGFTEKSRLTAKYLASSFAFYRKAGESCVEVFESCEARGWRRIALCGVSDLAEIASLRALERGIEIVGIYDPHTERRRFVDKSVWRKFDEVEDHDAWILTDLNAPRVAYEHLTGLVARERILVPDILRLD